MKRYLVLIVLLAPLCVLAQKEIKPNLNKAEAALRAGKLDEAKSYIDVTVSSDAFMKDKKGQPTKNAAKAWYIKGLIYTGIDTTNNQSYKSLAENPLETAKEAFTMAYQIDGHKSEYFIMKPDNILPWLDSEIRALEGQAYLERALAAFNNEKDYKKGLMEIEKTLYFVPTDTNILYLAGANFAQMAEDWDKSIEYLQKYLDNGGKNDLADILILDTYYNRKNDLPKALAAAEVGKKKYPANAEFSKYELNIYLSEKKYDKAQRVVLEDIQRNPEDADSWTRLGSLCFNLNKLDSAKIAYQKAVELNPTDFQTQLDLATMYYDDAKKVKAERDKLGISPKDITKRKELFDILQAKYKTALPYWERALKLNPKSEQVLYTLSEMYTSLVMDDKAEAMRKKMKEYGYSD